MQGKIKVLGICASPRADSGHSHSHELMMELINQVHLFGGEPSRILLAQKKLRPCQGCYSIKPRECTFPCVHVDDDTNEILTEIMNTDALVFATPVYWGSASALLHILIEKMTALENNRWQLTDQFGRDPLEGKPFVILGSELMEGAALMMLQISWALIQMGMFPLPYGFTFQHSLFRNRGVQLAMKVIGEKRFNYAEGDIRLAARNLIGIAKLLKDANYRFDDDIEREKEW